MGSKIYMIGKVYGRLTVLEEDQRRDKSGAAQYLCKCQCGKLKIVSGSSLRKGTTVSCGCYNHEVITKENPKRKRPLYKIYSAILGRCNNPNNKSYRNYGMRGIKMEWDGFDEFEQWSMTHGYKQGLWLDRIDNNKGYSPDNCRWATPKVQQNNKRTNIYLEIDGETKTLTEWAEYAGIKPCTLQRRINLGWAKEELFKEVDKRYSHSEQIKEGMRKKKGETI